MSARRYWGHLDTDNLLAQVNKMVVHGLYAKPLFYDAIKRVPPLQWIKYSHPGAIVFPEDKLIDKVYRKIPELKQEIVNLTKPLTPTLGYQIATRWAQYIEKEKVSEDDGWNKAIADADISSAVEHFKSNLPSYQYDLTQPLTQTALEKAMRRRMSDMEKLRRRWATKEAETPRQAANMRTMEEIARSYDFAAGPWIPGKVPPTYPKLHHLPLATIASQSFDWAIKHAIVEEEASLRDFIAYALNIQIRILESRHILQWRPYTDSVSNTLWRQANVILKTKSVDRLTGDDLYLVESERKGEESKIEPSPFEEKEENEEPFLVSISIDSEEINLCLKNGLPLVRHEDQKPLSIEEARKHRLLLSFIDISMSKYDFSNSSESMSEIDNELRESHVAIHPDSFVRLSDLHTNVTYESITQYVHPALVAYIELNRNERSATVRIKPWSRLKATELAWKLTKSRRLLHGRLPKIRALTEKEVKALGEQLIEETSKIKKEKGEVQHSGFTTFKYIAKTQLPKKVKEVFEESNVPPEL